MLSVISAEAMKFTRHRATWGLVWIWPIGILLIGLLAIGVGLASTDGGAEGEATAAGWIASNVGFWQTPGHAFGRYLIGAFAAIVFAGEYGWNTWKLIVPHRARSSLIAAKYVVAILLVFAGFALAALLFNAVGLTEDLLTGDPIPPGLTVAAVGQAHALGALASLFPIALTIGYVSLAAILTRSTVAALVIGLIYTTLEQLFRGLAPMFEPYAPAVVHGVYYAAPGYHLANIAGWITQSEIVQVPFAAGPFWTQPGTSFAIVGAWTLLVVALTFRVFRRQDIN